MASAFSLAFLLWKVFQIDWASAFLINVGLTIIIWFAVTLLTKPADKSRLLEFYRKIKPGGFWGPIAKEAEHLDPRLKDLRINLSLRKELLNWVLGSIMIYTALFGIGKIILGDFLVGFVFLGLFILSSIGIFQNLTKRKPLPQGSDQIIF